MEETLPIEEFKFKEIKLEEVQSALQASLQDYFCDVDVKIVGCPDISKAPFNLATKGFGGGETGIIDLGGVPYLVPLVDRTRIYDLTKITSKYIGSELGGFSNGFYVSGAAAGPWPSQGTNCEMVVNMLIGKDGTMLNNKSRVALMKKSTGASDPSTETVILRELEKEESRCALLANLMVSSGIPGNVLRVQVGKRRDSSAQLTGSIRSSLSKTFGNEPVGLGGFFMVQDAKTKVHVMPDFSTNPLNSDKDVENWLKFFDMDPPMLFQSIIISADPGLDLRVEHSHGWSLCGKSEGGHYHYDVQPETAQYTGYYAVAKKLWRIDRPKVTHFVGRD